MYCIIYNINISDAKKWACAHYVVKTCISNSALYFVHFYIAFTFLPLFGLTFNIEIILHSADLQWLIFGGQTKKNKFKFIRMGDDQPTQSRVHSVVRASSQKETPKQSDGGSTVRKRSFRLHKHIWPLPSPYTSLICLQEIWPAIYCSDPQPYLSQLFSNIQYIVFYMYGNVGTWCWTIFIRLNIFTKCVQNLCRLGEICEK